MSIFHFKAILKERLKSGEHIYTYYPDCVVAEEVIGEFSIRPDNFEPIILVTTNAEEKGLVSTDLRCVLALASKIKMIYEETSKFPNEVLRIS